MASVATWTAIALAVLKLIGALFSQASASKQSGETTAAALGRILDDAMQTIEAANKARAAAATRDATDDGLRKSDGFQRD